MYDMRRARNEGGDEYVVNEIAAYTKEHGGFNRSRLVTPLLVAGAVLLFVLFLFGGGRHAQVDKSEYHGKEKNALVIIDSEWYLIPQSNAKQMHYISGGSGDPLFVLLHGQSRRYQDARHWSAHFDLFDTLGTFCAPDLLGHGESVPGRHDETRVSLFEQAEYVSKLLAADFAAHQEVVLVARGWGVNVALELGKRIRSKLKAMVFVAPEVDDLVWQSVPNYVITTPLLLVWAMDDPVSDFADHANFVDLFTNLDPYFIEQVADAGIHKMVANSPENIRVFEFQNQVHDFLERQGLI